VLSVGDPPNVGEGGSAVIVIGVDAHKQTHTVVAVDIAGRQLDELTVSAREDGHQQLLRFAARLDIDRIWAVEDCRHVSGALERFLLRSGQTVIRVPPKLMAGQRKAARTYGKSDPIDALAVARAAIREPDLPKARLAGPEREIALILDFRADLVSESTRTQSRLRWLLHDLDPDIVPAARALSKRGVLLTVGRRLARREQTVQVKVCREMIRVLLELVRRINALEAQLRPLVKRHAAALLAIPGVGVITAARLIAEIAHIDRFRTDAQLAIYAGAAPLDASSGKQRRHRLNRTGNRQLNSALHVIALTQARIHPPAREYLARRRSEGKTTTEAIRALKRHLARMIFRAFKALQTTSERASIPIQGAPSVGCLT
jgi:transposase